jgi:hypothetical protein
MNLKKTGFDLLKARGAEDNLDIDAMEKQYGLQLPPLYRLFAQTYHLGETKLFRPEYWDEQKKRLFPLMGYIFEKNHEAGFSYFISLEEAFANWKAEDDKEYFPIAGGNYAGIYVALTPPEVDKVILDTCLSNRYIVLADNVFEFVRNIEVKLIDREYLYTDFSTEQLYKNWGEDFWRIREE